MIFNSLEFVFFFVPFFLLYWLVFNRNIKGQNLFILAGSYLFYAWWDWRVLFPLIGCSIVNYTLGIYISKTENENFRRALVFTGILYGLGNLFFFKYLNFFLASLIDLFSIFNFNLNKQTFNFILPLGISFYTFRGISYLIDIHHEKIKPTTCWIVFFSYISFFPSLLAGPIDRAKKFIPQLEKNRIFNYETASDGMRQILWGLLKKIVVADNCEIITNQIFSSYENQPASSLFLGMFFYTIQIYADFSGYSDMAIGFARLIGFDITKNFSYPFFSQNIAEFWQKWHISLTTWMTDYVFTPLSFIFRSMEKLGVVLSILITFILIGLWHGSNWTFIVFGFIHGCCFIPLIYRGALTNKQTNEATPSTRKLVNILGTFTFIMLTTVIFRSDTLVDAYHYYSSLFSSTLFSIPPISMFKVLVPLLFIFIMFYIEWLGKEQNYGIEHIGKKWHKLTRWAFYFAIVMAIFLFGQKEHEFIYLQF